MPDWLLESGQHAAQSFFAAFGVVVSLAILRKALRGPRNLQPVETGSIRMSRTLIWTAAGFGASFAIMVGILMIVERSDPALSALGPICIAMFSLMTIGSVVSTSPHYLLNWDATGVEGPAKEFSIGWRVPRRLISWGDLREYVEKANGTVCLISHNEEKVHYSKFYAGYGVFEATLRARRPDLF